MSVVVPDVLPALMVMVAALSVYEASTSGVTVTSLCHAPLSVAVTVLVVARVEPPTFDS